MKFIYCDMVDRTYLINVESIRRIAVEVDLIASGVYEKDAYIAVDFTIDATESSYELREDIEYNCDIHRKPYVALEFAPAITKALYEFIEVKNFIDLKDVVRFAEREICKNVLLQKIKLEQEGGELNG